MRSSAIMAEGGEESVELKFRVYDGTDIAHRTYASTTSIATLKERVVAEWPQDKTVIPKSLNDVKLIYAGKVLDNTKTLAESRIPFGELPGGVITMHVVVQPPIAKKKTDVFGPAALRPDMTLPRPSQLSATAYPIDFYVPPPVDPQGLVVWTTQGTTMGLPVPPVPAERVQQLLPQLYEWDVDQLRHRLAQTTLDLEARATAILSYTETIVHQARASQEAFSSSQHHVQTLLAESARLQTEIDRLRLAENRRTQRDESGTSRRRAGPSTSGSRGSPATRARRGQ